MSVWSGIAAAGVAIALAFVAVGSSLWEWQLEDSQQREVWAYGPFQAHHYIFNKTSGMTAPDRYYDYGNFTAQPSMSKVFQEFGQFFVIGLIASFGGEVLAILAAWKKVRGIFAALAFLGGCASTLYASFGLVFKIPEAAGDLPPFGNSRVQFNGGAYGGSQVLSTTPTVGWFLVIGMGLALAWACSDLWHIVPSKKLSPKKIEVTVKRIPSTASPPPPPPEQLIPSTPEPLIEEVL